MPRQSQSQNQQGGNALPNSSSFSQSLSSLGPSVKDGFAGNQIKGGKRQGRKTKGRKTTRGGKTHRRKIRWGGGLGKMMKLKN